MKTILLDPAARPVTERCITTSTGIAIGCAHVRTERQPEPISGPWRKADTLADRAVVWACVLAGVFLAGLLIWERMT